MWSLVFIPIAVLSQTCPTYNCHEGGFSIAPTCAQVASSGNIQLQICDDPSFPFCNTLGTITKNFTCADSPPYTPSLAYPGEFCLSNSDCITNLCQSNSCVGQRPGGGCTSNSDCGIGLYCNSAFFCSAQLNQYQTCNSDYECLNNLGCNRTIFEPGLCVPYYIIPNGSPVGMCIDLLTESVSNLCSSGSCTLLNPGFDSVGICSPAYISATLEYPQQCQTDFDCLGTNGISTSIGSCSCGLDKDGHAYCDAFAGDPPSSTVQLIVQLHVSNNAIFNCHTQRRFDDYCLTQNLNPSTIQRYYKNRALATDTARYQGNDYCAQTIFNSQFFNITPSSFGCQAHSCANLQGWQAGTCLTFTEATNGYAINPCDPDSQDPYCDFRRAERNKWRNVTCGPAPSAPLKHPGDPCQYGDECYSGSCLNGFCRGIAEGQSCRSSEECNVGLYCESLNYLFTCQPLIYTGSSGCGSDYDCVNSAGCNYGANGPPGVCVTYYTLPLGSQVACSVDGLSNLCGSGACYNGGNGLLGICVPPPVSSSPLPTLCTVGGQCTGRNQVGQSFVGTCVCGYNGNGSSYCKPFIGDAPGINYLTATISFLAPAGPIGLCQTTRRFSQDCFDLVAQNIGQDPRIWYSQYLYFTYYPYLVDNDECVKATYTNEYCDNLPDQYFSYKKKLSKPTNFFSSLLEWFRSIKF